MSIRRTQNNIGFRVSIVIPKNVRMGFAKNNESEPFNENTSKIMNN